LRKHWDIVKIKSLEGENMAGKKGEKVQDKSVEKYRNGRATKKGGLAVFAANNAFYQPDI
jgi:hypothetical protein